MAESQKIKNIQFKRGRKAALESKLTSANSSILKAGEPAFESDTGKLKIGDGIHDYLDLQYIGGANSSDDRFIIMDPKSNQILIYDEESQKWLNKDLADKESIIYLSSRGLTIKGYDTAKAGQMLVKDDTDGLSWQNALTDADLRNAVQEAANSSKLASDYATNAGNEAVKATQAASTASRINEQTMNYVNNKF